MLRPGHTDAACINGNALAPPYGQSMADIFVAARAAFSEVVRQGRSTRTLAANKVDFNGAYSNSNFKVVEFDSLVKIAATDASVWTCDESAPRELHHIVETGQGLLAHSSAPASAPGHARETSRAAADAASWRKPAGAAAAAGTAWRRAALGASACSIGSADPHGESRSTRACTALFCRERASLYVAGVAVEQLHVGAPFTRSGPVQQLLQVERQLCFLLAQDGKDLDNTCS